MRKTTARSLLRASLMIAPLLLLLGGGFTAPQAAAEEWIQLFNGENLDGWKPKIRGYEYGVNYADTFRVEDGLLKVRYDGYEDFQQQYGHLFYQDTFSHYVIRVEYRFVGEQAPGGEGWAFRNSGVMLHGQDPETMTLDQDFPASIEAQLLGGSGQGERTTANLCTPGTNVVMDDELVTRHCTSSNSETYHGDQWVTVELEVHGSEVIRHVIDGEVVLEYQHPQLDPNAGTAQPLMEEGESLLLDEGTISIQSESHPIDFRTIEIRILQE